MNAPLQDRDDIQDHGPDADAAESDGENVGTRDEGREEEEGDGEDLLDENMWKCGAVALNSAFTCLVYLFRHAALPGEG